jgi:ribosomal protein S18 acetylase RimI-like enzyme
VATIRRAVAADADSLSRIGRATFIESFAVLYTAEDMHAFLDEKHSVAYYARFLADPANAAWIVEDAGEPIGYALAGPCGLPHAEVRDGDGELLRFYLQRDRQKGGLGSALFAGVIEWLEASRPASIWMSVWSGNDGAQRFYARHGFEKAGEYEFVVGRQRDHEFMFRRLRSD